MKLETRRRGQGGERKAPLSLPQERNPCATQKIYNAENIIEAEMLVEMLKENGIAAFTQEPSSSVAAYGVAGFGVYGVDIWAEADEAEKAVQIIEEIEKSLDTENAE